jgi:RNA polymerase sigma-70 factor (ECF subfamily)
MSSDDRGDDLLSPAEADETVSGLLSDEPTVELIIRARAGNAAAVDALLQRCLPTLKRWAHGKLPAAARSYIDTGDLVQEAALKAIQHLDTFEPRHVDSMQAYLRKSVINRVRDEVRRLSRRGVSLELSEDTPSDGQSPLELAIATQAYQGYREALTKLKSRDRQIAVARLELQWTAADIEEHFRFPTRDAARVATVRAIERLATALNIPVGK